MDGIKEFKTMHSEFLKYGSGPTDDSRNASPEVSARELESLPLETLIEEIWLMNDKDEANQMLSVYSGLITQYEKYLLNEVIFGPEFTIEFEDIIYTKIEEFHTSLDSGLSFINF